MPEHRTIQEQKDKSLIVWFEISGWNSGSGGGGIWGRGSKKAQNWLRELLVQASILFFTPHHTPLKSHQ